MLKRNEDDMPGRQAARIRPPAGFSEQEWDALNRLRRVQRPWPWLPALAATGVAAVVAVGVALYVARPSARPADPSLVASGPVALPPAQPEPPQLTAAAPPTPPVAPAPPQQAALPSNVQPRSEPPIGGPLVAARPADPSPAPSPPEPMPALRPPLPAREMEALVSRAERLLAEQRDVAGARLLLQRAEQRGSARAAFLLAETFDPERLQEMGARGIRGDAERARALYEQAQAGGIADAEGRLQALR